MKLIDIIRTIAAAIGEHYCAGCGRALGPLRGRWELVDGKVFPTCLNYSCVRRLGIQNQDDST